MCSLSDQNLAKMKVFGGGGGGGNEVHVGVSSVQTERQVVQGRDKNLTTLANAIFLKMVASEHSRFPLLTGILLK